MLRHFSQQHRGATIGIFFGVAAFVVGLLLLAVNVSAAPNYEINYQGKLTDDLGATVADGLYDMRFRLYDAPTGGNVVWTEFASTTVSNGLFSVMLGSSTPLTSVDFNQTLYLGVRIEADNEMTPRKILGAVPAAFEAANAETFDNLATTSFLRSDQADTALGLLTFSNGLISQASSTIFGLTTNTATTTNLVINGQRFTNLLGSGLTNVGNALTANISEANLNIAVGPTNGYVLQASSTAVGGLAWVATSSLNIDTGIAFSFGTDNQIPYTSAGGDDFDYSASLTFDGTLLTAPIFNASGASSTVLTLNNNPLFKASTYSLALGLGAGLVTESIAIGNGAMANASATAGYGNIAIGGDTLPDVSGDRNVVVGLYSASALTTGSDNIVIGGDAFQYTSEGSNNVAIGYRAMYFGAATNSVAIGYEAGHSSFGTLINETLVGHQAGRSLTTGINNLLLGYRSGDALTTGDNNILIGYDIDLQNNAWSNRLNIGNLIFGTGIDGTGTTISSGNIGIGTTTPANLFHIFGTSPIMRLTDADTGASSNISANSSSGSLTLGADIDNTAGGSAINFFIDNNQYARLTSDGNFGIGTSTPESRLHIAGNGDTTLTIQSNDSNDPTLFFKSNINDASGDWSVYSDGTDDDKLKFRNEDGTSYDVLTLTQAGQGASVGIGTSSPASKLDVWGDFRVGTSGTPAFFTDVSTGRVGIGTSTPAYDLDIYGDARIDGDLVDSTGSAGTAGWVLQTTATGIEWVATSSLNITGGATVTFGTDNQIPFTNSGGTDYDYSASLTFDGTLLTAPIFNASGASTTVMTINNTPFFKASSTLDSFAIGLRTGGLSAYGNFALGSDSLFSNTTGSENIALGPVALYENISGSENIAIGSDAMNANLTGDGNVAIGSGALISGTSTEINTGVGYQALYNFEGDATGNSALGAYALWGHGAGASGSGNVGVGREAGFLLTTGSNNILMGYQAGDALTSGSNNIAIGYDIDFPTNTGSNRLNIGNLLFGTGIDGTGTTLSSGNIGIGTSSPSAKLTIDNTVVPVGSELVTNGTFTGSAASWTLGDCAAYDSNQVTVLYDGVCNSAEISTNIAIESGNTYLLTFTVTNNADQMSYYFDNNTGSYDDSEYYSGTHTVTFVSDYTGTDTITFGSWNWINDTGWSIDNVSIKEIPSVRPAFAVHDFTGAASTVFGGDSFGNLGLGNRTLSLISSGVRNTALGILSLSSDTTGTNNTATGYAALFSNTSGSYNTATGYAALTSNTTGLRNTAMGWGSLLSNLSANNNAAVGHQSLYSNLYGSNNVAMGNNTLYSNTTGSHNTAFGHESLYSNISGQYNTAVGYVALADNDGEGNTGVGSAVLTNNTTGFYNTGLGGSSLINNTVGFYNTAVGSLSLFGNTTGSHNVSIGRSALYLNNGTGTIAIGYQAGNNLTSGDNNIIIGYDIDAPTATSDNILNIGNLLFGTGIDGTGTTLSSGNIGIGTSSPDYKLDVFGDARIDGDLVDSTGSAGTAGWVLQTTATGIEWVATSSLNISSGSAITFGTDNQIPYTNSGGTDYDYSANFTFDGSLLSITGDSILTGNSTTTGTGYFDGHVGINAAPSANWELLVNGYARVDDGYYYNSATGQIQHLLSSSGNYGTIQNNAANVWSLGWSTDQGTTIENSVLTWNTSGNVGIGTSTPAYKLDVYGDARIDGDIFLAPSGSINFGSDYSFYHYGFDYLETSAPFAGISYSSSDPGIYSSNKTDAASVVATIFQGQRATPANFDLAYNLFRLDDSLGNNTEIAREKWIISDITNGSEDGAFVTGVMTAGTLADKTRLEGSVFSPAVSDGTALGSATYQWGDLFLASGGDINWNGGDVTLAHASDFLGVYGGMFGAEGSSAAGIQSLLVSNLIDNASVKVALFQGDRATPATNDEAYMSLVLSDSAGNQDEFGRLTWIGTDVTSTSEDGAIDFEVMSAGSLDRAFLVDGNHAFVGGNTLQLYGYGSVNNDVYIRDNSYNELLAFNPVASAVNHVQLTNAITGAGPVLSAVGGDTDIDLTISAKGSGNLLLLPDSGNVGIGTTNPFSEFHVQGNSTFSGQASYPSNANLGPNPFGGQLASVDYVNSRDFSNVSSGVLSSIDFDDQGDTAIGVWGDGEFVYVANGAGGLLTYSVANTGALTFIDADDQGDTANGVWGDGKFIYLANGAGGLLTYSVSDTGVLTHIDTDNQGDAAYGVWGDGKFIYLANGTGGLHTYSVSDTGILTHIDADDQGDTARGVWGDGKFIYLANNAGGLLTYSVSDTGVLTFIDSDDQGGFAYSAWGDGKFIYLANNTSGLLTYSVSNTGVLTFIHADDQGDTALNVWGDGKFIYLANNTGGLHTYSVSDTGTLTHIDADDQGNNAYGVWGDHNFIYLANYGGGLHAYSLDNAYEYDKANQYHNFLTGNVGIGTTTPEAKLHIVDNSINGSVYEKFIIDGNSLDSTSAGSGLVIGFRGWGDEYFGAVGGYSPGTDTGIGLWGGTKSGAPDLFVNDSGFVGIGSTTPVSRLTIDKTGITGTQTAGIMEYLGVTNSTLDAVIFGDYTRIDQVPTATSTTVGQMMRIYDTTELGNTVRGMEIQAHRGENTQGENTGLSAFGRTFGLRGTTQGDAGGVFQPAGVFAQTRGTTQGNAIRAYSASITTEDLVSLFHDTSDFEGAGLLMNFGNSGGSFSTSSGKFLDLQLAGISKFTVTSHGTTTIGDGTMGNVAGLQIGFGGLCVDDDGSCIAPAVGEIISVASSLGNSDLAEMYFSSEELLPGELVVTDSFLSIKRADQTNKNRILGVVSTKPGLTLGHDDTSLIFGQQSYPLALSGRVPVRLSDENGPIEPGDPLMLSSVPGVAMRANESGVVVGYALEAYDGTHAYTEGYVNQFGDDIAEPNYEPLNQNTDERLQDGCYAGAGGAVGDDDEFCVPQISNGSQVSTLTAEKIAEQRYLAEQRALQDLLEQEAEEISLDNGESVRVGQIIMFVDRGYHQVVAQADLLNELTSTSTDIVLGAKKGTAETLWSRVKELAQQFVDGVLTVAGLKADRIETNELCVDDVCVTAEDLRALLEAANRPESGSGNSVPPPPPPTPDEPTDSVEFDPNEVSEEEEHVTEQPPSAELPPEETLPEELPLDLDHETELQTPQEEQQESEEEIVPEQPMEEPPTEPVA